MTPCARSARAPTSWPSAQRVDGRPGPAKTGSEVEAHPDGSVQEKTPPGGQPAGSGRGPRGMEKGPLFVPKRTASTFVTFLRRGSANKRVHVFVRAMS